MDPIYLNDLDSCYVRDFEATIIDEGESEGRFVVLDRTAFYPLGGGQPSDTGRLEWIGGSCIVGLVRKKGAILHFVPGEPPVVGTKVVGIIDWDNRYGNMKMHTAQHMVSSILWRRYLAKTVGNQIHPERSRIDFAPLRISKEDLPSIEEEANRMIMGTHPVNIDFRERSYFEGSSDVERLDMDRIPKDIPVLRTVSIGKDGWIDTCPCAGTHVRNLSELGGLRITSIESKGKERMRLEYILEDRKG
jgi:misacylated tRNA(Ala) deacylase